MKRKLFSVILSSCMLVSFIGCNNIQSPKDSDTSTTTVTEHISSDQQKDVEVEEENYNTGDASLDDPLNQDNIGEREILVVSFGTSFNDSRRLTIGAIEKAMQDAYPDWSVRRAFTSQIIIDHILKRDNIKIDNLSEALERSLKNGVKTLIIQPTLLMAGHEYEEILEAIKKYQDSMYISVADPLLTDDHSINVFIENLVSENKEYENSTDTALVYMGHGTTADSNKVYTDLNNILHWRGLKNYFIGTVEAEPSIEDVISELKKNNYKKVILSPLMVVAGDHANNDMASDESDSWKTLLINAGFEVTPILKGLGEYSSVQTLYVSHTTTKINEIDKYKGLISS